jgi:hypothetical protein
MDSPQSLEFVNDFAKRIDSIAVMLFELSWISVKWNSAPYRQL